MTTATVDTLSDRHDAWFAKAVHLTFCERIDYLMDSQPLY